MILYILNKRRPFIGFSLRFIVLLHCLLKLLKYATQTLSIFSGCLHSQFSMFQKDNFANIQLLN